MSGDAVLDLARHLTVRDREILIRLYDVQVLTTDQLALLFFSSLRRCQDRLLFLYRHRLLDRFYPPSQFGSGKPQAHWLLDEAGAVMVAAIRRVDRKRLGWQRRQDWASHPQLAHRLESNRFVTDLIGATLSRSRMGVTEWYSSRDAAKFLDDQDFLRPDAMFFLDFPAGPVACVLEWDRGTETQQVLGEKLDRYRLIDTGSGGDGQRLNVLFVVPGQGRVKTLRRALLDIEPKLEKRRQDRWAPKRDAAWLLLVATVGDLREQGPLGRVWQSIEDERDPLRALSELPTRPTLRTGNLALALGREWRYDQPGFWDRLSPLSRRTSGTDDQPATEDDPEESWVVRYQQAQLEEMRRDAARLGQPRPRHGGWDEGLNPGSEDGVHGESDDLGEDSWA